MAKGRLIRLGTSLVVVIPKPALTQLGWFQADEIESQVRDGTIVLQNTTKHTIRPITEVRGYGDKKACK